MNIPIINTGLVINIVLAILINNTLPIAWGSDIKTLLVIEPSKEYPRNSEGDVVQLKGGRLCLVYTRFTSGSGDFSSADIVCRTSSDDGKTWSKDRILVRNEGQNNIMSVSIIRLRNDELLLFYMRKNGWNDCNLYVRRSPDEFETLGEPVRVTVEDGYHVVNNDRVVQLSNGRLIAPAALHLCPDGTRKTWTGYGIPRVFLSDDEGRTWHPDKMAVPSKPSRDVLLQEPGVLELKDGRLWMWMRTGSGVQYQCFSRNGGLHWSDPEPSTLASPRSPATIERIDWTGDLLCVWNDHSGWHNYPKGRRTPLCLALSKDDGRTWSKSRVIEGNPDGWYCYTSMTFIKNRVILAYCAGDSKVGGLNRLKVISISRDWLYLNKQKK
ncbi:MAG: sialidase family protein [Planctomycetota bacterium]